MQLKPWQLAKPKKKKKPRPPPPEKAEKSLFAANNKGEKSLFGVPRAMSLTGGNDSLQAAMTSGGGSPGGTPRSRRASFNMAGSPRNSPGGSTRARRASFSPMTTTSRKRTLSSAEPVPKDEGPWEYRCPVYAFPGGSVSASGNAHYNGGVVCSIHLLCENAEALSFCESRCVSLFCRAEE